MASHLELNFTEQFFRRVLYTMVPLLPRPQRGKTT